MYDSVLNPDAARPIAKAPAVVVYYSNYVITQQYADTEGSIRGFLHSFVIIPVNHYIAHSAPMSARIRLSILVQVHV